MIARPICPRCGSAMKTSKQVNKNNGYARTRFRCKRSSCHYATTNKTKVLR
jgi:transposase-like protein